MANCAPVTSRVLTAVAIAMILTAGAKPLAAQTVAPPEAKPALAENCPGLVAADRPNIIPAAFRLAALQADQVRLTFIGHATFLIESPQLVRIASDYNDYVRPRITPDIATMNHAHATHYTDTPDPSIKYVLRGWGPDQETPAHHDIQYKDVRVRNVSTNIRDWRGGTEYNGNSIFIFEIANLCIAHLGHLHHTLTHQQLNDIGHVDVVMFPVDGTVTLDQPGMVEVLQSLKAPIMIPMHAFSGFTLNRFLDRVRDTWSVETSEIPSVVLSKATIPTTPKILVLPGR